jgi:hypothetical protein
MHALPGFGAGINREQKDFGTTSTRCGDHPFAESEFHLTRLEVGDNDDQTALEFLRRVGSLDPRKNRASDLSAETHGQLDKLFGFGNLFGFYHPRYPQIDFDKVVDSAGRSQWLELQRL